MFLGRIFFKQEKIPRPDLKIKRGIFAKPANGIYPIAVWIIAVGLALYPIYIFPLYHPQKYREFIHKKISYNQQLNIGKCLQLKKIR